MRAIVYDGRLRCVLDYALPEMRSGWARIRVLKAGICSTDREITRGYKGFKGVLGHEFVGVVDANAPSGNDRNLVGQRVVGEINVGCGQCDLCLSRLERHCPHRRALGILDLDGCMADYCVLPIRNLRVIPSGISDNRAVLVEPLSAALEILDQISLKGFERAMVLGDGPIGILCAWALLTVLPDVTLIGRHPLKLERARWRGLKTQLGPPTGMEAIADIVVEATGSTRGLADAVTLCRPRGTVVLKSTLANPITVDLSSVVVNEQTLIGSRCGRFEAGLRMLRSYLDLPMDRLISVEYPIEEARSAFASAVQPETLKVLIYMGGTA